MRFLKEKYLREDKMIKYNGELSPKFGWCVFYIGGGASGKSTATKYLSRIQGKYFNVDDWKENKNFWQIINPDTGDTYESGFKTPEEERDLGNSDFAAELHHTFKKSSDKVKHQMLNNPANNPDRLPNIIFDMTGDNIKKIDEIVSAVKPQGYKIAIIWILNTYERAKQNIARRERKGSPDLLAGKHRDVLKTVREMFASNYISNIDEFWIIDASTGVNPVTDSNAYHDLQNVYHIPTTPEGINSIRHIQNLMNRTESQIDQYYSNK